MNFLKNSFNRRNIIIGTGIIGLSSLFSHKYAKATTVSNNQKGAYLYRPASKEAVFIPTDWNDNDHLKCSVLFRDLKDNNQGIFIDPNLINLLIRINIAANSLNNKTNIIYILSGYRTKKHNSMLEGAAKNSLHMQGRAVDFTISGFENLACAKLAAMIGAGGVGVYDNFTHMDTGKNRTWISKKLPM